MENKGEWKKWVNGEVRWNGEGGLNGEEVMEKEV